MSLSVHEPRENHREDPLPSVRERRLSALRYQGAVAGIRCTKNEEFSSDSHHRCATGYAAYPVVTDKILSAPAGRVPVGDKINKLKMNK